MHILTCTNNNLTNFNVSQLTQLTSLNINHNQLTALDLSNCPNLQLLYCPNNQINSLNFLNNPLLENVFCSNNQLTSLDFSNNMLFNQLDCQNNPNLTSVNIQNGAVQLYGTQTYYNQCWSGLPNLTTICADSNEITATENYFDLCGIDRSNINITKDCGLANATFANNNLDKITISPNPSDGNFSINFQNQVNEATLELYSIIGQKIFSENFNNISDVKLSMNRLSIGTYLLKIKSEEKVVTKKIIIK